MANDSELTTIDPETMTNVTGGGLLTGAFGAAFRGGWQGYQQGRTYGHPFMGAFRGMAGAAIQQIGQNISWG